MTDKKQIEEMAKSCCSRAYKTCKERIKKSEKILGKVDIYECECYSYASRFFNKGYHRTIWHKVADGDLPKYAGSYLVVCGSELLPEYDVDFYENFYKNHKDGKRWVHNEGRVIAWAELPKYKE